jgi:AcrR family transcriptional regulator
VDEIIRLSGVAKATFYRHFPSKDDLMLALLDRREELWTRGFVEAAARRPEATPENRLLGIFDAFDEWFRRPEFEAGPFMRVLLEMGPDHPLGQASARHLANLRAIVAQLATEAELPDPESLAHSWHILIEGSIVSALAGDKDAARRARSIGSAVIEQHRRLPVPPDRRPARRVPGAQVSTSARRVRRPQVSTSNGGLGAAHVDSGRGNEQRKGGGADA